MRRSYSIRGSRAISRHQRSPVAMIALLAWAIVVTIASPVSATDQIIEVRDGSASIQNGDRQQAATSGTELNTGDLIRPAAGAVVVVRCHNGNIREVRFISGLADICPDSVASRYSSTGRAEDAFLAFLNQQFTYATQFLDPQPLLRWSAIEGATAYRVQVVDQADTVVWEQTVEATEVRYDGDALQPGKPYQLLVTATDRTHSVPTARLVFRLLEEHQAALVQMAVAQLESADLSEAGQAIGLTQIYLSAAQPNTLPPEGAGLAMEAIPVLEGAIEQGSATPYVHRLLGDLYLQVGLLASATEQYQTVLTLTDSTDDLQNRSAAQVGLANLAAGKGDRAAAEEWLMQARESYTQLSDAKRVNSIDEWLMKLNL